MYWEKPVFEYSPSLAMSMPHSACIRTASATCRARMARSPSLNGLPSSLRWRISTISGGRTRLPTWVVRIRRLLRFTGLAPHAGSRGSHTFASLLLAQNAPITYVSARFVHTDATTTLRWYARWLLAADAYDVLLDHSSLLLELHVLVRRGERVARDEA